MHDARIPSLHLRCRCRRRQSAGRRRRGAPHAAHCRPRLPGPLSTSCACRPGRTAAPKQAQAHGEDLNRHPGGCITSIGHTRSSYACCPLMISATRLNSYSGTNGVAPSNLQLPRLPHPPAATIILAPCRDTSRKGRTLGAASLISMKAPVRVSSRTQGVHGLFGGTDAGWHAGPAHPLVAADREALARDGLPVANALHQAVPNDGVLVLACGACTQNSSAPVRSKNSLEVEPGKPARTEYPGTATGLHATSRPARSACVYLTFRSIACPIVTSKWMQLHSIHRFLDLEAS